MDFGAGTTCNLSGISVEMDFTARHGWWLRHGRHGRHGHGRLRLGRLGLGIMNFNL